MMYVNGAPVSFRVDFSDVNSLSRADLQAYLRQLQKMELDTTDVGLIYPISQKRKEVQQALATKAL